MGNENVVMPWVSFCMSTYKRPVILKRQIEIILQQTFKNFEVVVSDNDPESSAEMVVSTFNDSRLKYYPNGNNFGMTKSFNLSIERSLSSYVVMITDDDPVLPEMLETFYQLSLKHPGYGVYIGCTRTGKKEGSIEVFDNKNFGFQILHPALTTNFLWSSCILKKDILLKIGGMPDYGSPHLADHALIVLCGNINGGVMMNRMFSHLTSHEHNFSKGSIHLYHVACIEFHNIISNNDKMRSYIKDGENALAKHLGRWFIVSMFVLKKYYTYQIKNKEALKQINLEANKMLQLPYLKHVRIKYYLKIIIFLLKKPLYNLRMLR